MTIKALQLCWLGKWIFRGQFKPIRTGYLAGDGRARPGGIIEKGEILEEHKTPDAVIMKEASQLLSSLAPPIPGYRLWQFLELGEQVTLPEESVLQLQVA